MEALAEALSNLLVNALDAQHWPFFSVCVVLAVIGQIMSKRVFTRERAHQRFGAGWRARMKRELFYWGRETLPLHPLAVSVLIALVWRDPEAQGWGLNETLAYWLLCGVCSLFAWAFMKGWAKHKGIELELPGDSGRPPELPLAAIPTMPPDAVTEEKP